MECRESLGRRVRVGAAIQQPGGELVVRIRGREQEHVRSRVRWRWRRVLWRALPNRQRVVHVCAGLDQRVHRRDSAFASGKQNCGESSIRTRAHVGATRHERLDDRGVPLRRGPHQRGLTAPLFFHVGIGAARKQQVDGIDFPRASRHHERGLSFVRCR